MHIIKHKFLPDLMGVLNDRLAKELSKPVKIYAT